MSDFEGAVLKWYVRNQLFFDLDLATREDVLLAKYEDLVTQPSANFSRAFSSSLMVRSSTTTRRDLFVVSRKGARYPSGF